ncbi:FAD-dependent oxidoreductase, partial [Alphaproteobacteria bacterium 46_93_T64]
APFISAEPVPDGFIVKSHDTELKCRHVINAAGLAAQSVANRIKTLSPNFIPRRFLAKGSYFTMNAPSPFGHLIYPVPNTASLGIHVTLDMAKQIRFGPDQEWVDDINYDIDAQRGAAFYSAIRKFYPNLPDNSLIPAYSGIRPKLQSPAGPAMDFIISGPREHNVPGLINLFGMESPGLTSSLRIGQHVCDLLVSKLTN